MEIVNVARVSTLRSAPIASRARAVFRGVLQLVDAYTPAMRWSDAAVCLQWAVVTFSQQLLLPLESEPLLIRDSSGWAHPSHRPKRHLDRFSHFYRAHECYQHRPTDHATPCLAIGRPMYIQWRKSGRDSGGDTGVDPKGLMEAKNFSLKMACFGTFWVFFLSVSSPEKCWIFRLKWNLVDVEDVLLGNNKYYVRVMGLVRF